MSATQREAVASDCGMPSEVWTRIDEELKRRRKSWPWLAERMGHDGRSRVGNWKSRGVPVQEYPAIAAALGTSIDWVAGAEVGPEPGANLSPMAMKIAREFDRISDDAAQLAAFAHIIGVIARAAGEAAAPPTMRPPPPPTDEHPPR